MLKTTNALIASTILLTFVSSISAQTPVKPDVVLISTARAKITYGDLIADLERLPEESRIEFLLNTKRVASVVENLLITKIMSAEAQQSGLQNNPLAAAEIRNHTERVLAKYRREQIEANAPKIDLMPLAREIYLVRLKDIERPAIYTAWHALIKTENRTREAALQLAKTVKVRVDSGEPLDAIAKTYSDDESKLINFGFIQPTPLAALDRGFADTLEKLKAGESALVETDYGVHVVRLIKMVPRVRPTFEDVKSFLLAEADKTYKQRLVEEHLTKIRTDPTLKLHTDVLDQVRPKLPEIPPPPTSNAPTRQF